MNELSVIEKRELRDLEKVIEGGLSKFLEVGQALREVRDRKLYRDGFKTFDKYVSDRWGFDRSRAYQLIEAAEVREDLSTIGRQKLTTEIVNERQLRELAKADEDSLPEVVKALEAKVEAGERVTAKVVKQVVAEVCEPEPEPEPDPEPAGPLDAADYHNAILGGVNLALRELKAVPEVAGTELLVGREKAIRAHLENAKSEIVSSKPEAICKRCKGKPDGCTVCGNLGWVTKANGV